MILVIPKKLLMLVFGSSSILSMHHCIRYPGACLSSLLVSISRVKSKYDYIARPDLNTAYHPNRPAVYRR